MAGLCDVSRRPNMVQTAKGKRMKIATFNINGIKARIDALPAWLAEATPDVVCLQEIKSQDEAFPREIFESLGYRVETHGQKSFNGVAILSKLPLEDVVRGLPGDDTDEQARWIEATVIGTKAVRICGLYLPQSRAAFRSLLNLGLTDAFRVRNPNPGQYTFWDYQAGAWDRNNGIRIDHHLLSPQAADLLQDCQIDKQVRAGDKPSDHVPVWIDLAA